MPFTESVGKPLDIQFDELGKFLEGRSPYTTANAIVSQIRYQIDSSEAFHRHPHLFYTKTGEKGVPSHAVSKAGRHDYFQILPSDAIHPTRQRLEGVELTVLLRSAEMSLNRFALFLQTGTCFQNRQSAEEHVETVLKSLPEKEGATLRARFEDLRNA
ncbi:hypothetical protein A3D88_02255 [Candidatus Peribacteria bacterium RIFCSPHIGHO2_02_FULL_52_16]|nr:MAG: hypothetical protein A2706_02690 [Candidatus Peribacteria bacterium RIFCSPHIGHO2_01_FULL_51_35]OGJ61443.1 MAG: hypothetical protein A3D88_02255 [Candidatus Peribacteria bacterium RIFCSPHIGHO2_02_FULL_52_16]